MNFWKFEIRNEKGEVLYSDCGYETEEDALQEADRILKENYNDMYLQNTFDIRTEQVWQELFYNRPTQVIVFCAKKQAEYSAIAYVNEVIFCDSGAVLNLGDVEVLQELHTWADMSGPILSRRIDQNGKGGECHVDHE